VAENLLKERESFCQHPGAETIRVASGELSALRENWSSSSRRPKL
jgi:hypothetical protein